MTATTQTSASRRRPGLREPAMGWEATQREFVVLAMAGELLAILDELRTSMDAVVSDDNVSELMLVARDRAADVVDDMRGQIRW